MKKTIPKQIYHKILKILPTKIAVYIIYFRGYHKVLNLKSPRYFGEKLQWLKLHGGLEDLSIYVDKYAVREYVKKKIGEEHLVRLLGVYEKYSDIDFSLLPQQFVIKSNNGTESLIICKDKDTLDEKKAKEEIESWFKNDFYKVKKEYQYKNIRTKILIEEYMDDGSGGLKDYKIYCFNGQPEWISVFSGRFTDKRVDTYTKEGELIPDFKNGSPHAKSSNNPPNKLDNIDELVAIAGILSEPFTFVRVDLYYVNGEVIFGELTFTDGAGSEGMYPLEKYDIQFGQKIQLKRIIK